MATLYFKVSSDWEQVVKLRQECEKLEAQLKKMDSRSAPVATKTLETQLESTKQQMMGLVTEAAKAGATMENDLKRKIDSVTKSSDELSSEIIKQRTIIRETQEDVRRLSEQYSKIGKYSPQSTSTLNQLNKAKAALNEQRYALGELQDQQVKNRLELRQLTREYQNFSKGTDKATVTVDALMSSLKRTAAEVGGLAAIRKFGSDVMNATGTMQQLHVALSTILQDGGKASKLIGEITQFAAKTPFNLEDVASGAKQLLAYGSSAETVVDELSMLGDVAAGLQIPIGQLIYLYGTLRTQGRAMTVDIRQFAGRGIPIYEELAKVLGVTKDKVGELVTAGEVGFKEVEQAFKNMTSEGGKFNDLMENSAGTWPQRMSNIQDTLFQKLNDFGNKYREVFEFGIGTTEELVEHLDDVISVIGSLIAAYGTYRAALIAAAVAQKAVGFVESIRLIMAYRKQLGLATAAQQAFNLASKSNVYVALLSVLVGLGTAIYMFTKRTKEATAAHEALSNVNKKADEEFSTQAATIDRLNGVLKSETASLEQKKKALGELQSIIPNYNAKLDEEGKLINNNTEAIKEYLVQLEKQIRLKAAQEELEELYRNKRLQEKNVQTQQSNYDRVREKNPIGVVYGGDAGIEAQRHELNRISDAEKALKKANDELKNTQTQIAAIEKEIEQASISSDNAPKTTYAEDYEQARKNWEEAKKELQKIEADKNKFTSKQYENAKKRVEATEKAYKELGGDTKNKGVKSENSILTLQSRIDELKQRQDQDRIRQQVDLEYQVAQARIDAMADGAEKASAQRELDNKKELEAIERQKEEYKQKVIQSQKEIFDAQEELKTKQNPNYKKRSFDSSSVSVDTSMFDIIYDFTQKKQVNDRIREQEQAMNRYLQEYGTFQQKRLAITEEYQQKISKAETEGEKLLLQKQMEEALSGIDMDELKESINWELVFSDLGNVSKKSLQQIKKQLGDFKESAEYKDMGMEQKKVVDEALNNIQSAIIDKGGLLGDLPTQLEELRKAQEDLTQAQEEYNKALAEGTDEQKEAAQKKLNKSQQGVQKAQLNVERSTKTATDNLLTLADAITQLGGNSEMTLSEIGRLAGGIADTFAEAGSKIGGIIGAIFTLLDQIGKQGLDGFLENVFSSVGSALYGVFDTLLGWGGFDFGGESDPTLERDIERLTTANQELEKAINNLSDKMDESSLAEALDIYEVQKENIQKMMANTRDMMYRSVTASSDGFLGIGGHHSSGYKIDNGMSAQDWEAISKVIGRQINGAGEFFMLSSEEMWKVANEATTEYAKLKELADDGYKDAAQFMDEYIGYWQELENLENEYREKLTSVSFDTIRNDFRNALLGMEDDAEAFSENFEKMMKDAVLESMMTEKYDKRLKDWYKLFSGYMEGGYLGEGEQDDLRDEWQGIVNDALEEWKHWQKIMGWDTESSANQQQSASSGGYETMTQDQASELKGRFTALNESSLRQEAIQQGISDIADDMRNIIAQSYIELQQISENTGDSAKYLKDIKADISIVKQNTSRI